ncbi:MAG TPA: tRNA uridine-5-carboxymethylaminomethyl(34) synthesis GTPase MnmE [Allosphingosinicella sp.]
MSETIFALSSGAPPAAIAVVRISGPKADTVLETLAGKLPEPRKAAVATLRRAGEVIDNALIIRFPGPYSATGEDIAELHLHGGRSVVAATLAALQAMPGLRSAEPGEFTRRAFENGRIDLAEAEGLADLLAAETQSQRRAALALARGALSRQVETWQVRLLALAAQLEAAIDFSEEGDVGDVALDLGRELERLAVEVEAFLRRPPAERLRDGIRVSIAGPPNAGKSTLLNTLVGREAAITSATPGTTRDLVEAPVAIRGVPFLFVDTAGLRATDDGIETIGVARAEEAIGAADLILWLGPARDNPDPARAVLVHPKADLNAADPAAEIAISALTGEGMDALLDLLTAKAAALLPTEGDVAINARHRAALAECLEGLREAFAERDVIIVAEAVRGARAALDRVTGRAGVEHMLDALFARFCIGK